MGNCHESFVGVFKNKSYRKPAMCNLCKNPLNLNNHSTSKQVVHNKNCNYKKHNVFSSKFYKVFLLFTHVHEDITHKNYEQQEWFLDIYVILYIYSDFFHVRISVEQLSIHFKLQSLTTNNDVKHNKKIQKLPVLFLCNVNNCFVAVS